MPPPNQDGFSSPKVGERGFRRAACLWAHLPDGQQHAGHEGLAGDGVVADRQRLALAAEQHLLVGHQAREAHGVDRLVHVPARRLDQLGGP